MTRLVIIRIMTKLKSFINNIIKSTVVSNVLLFKIQIYKLKIYLQKVITIG